MTKLHKRLVVLLELPDQATDRQMAIKLIRESAKVREQMEEYSGLR